VCKQRRIKDVPEKRQLPSDKGYPNCGEGYYDAQGFGQALDYCRWVGNGGCRKGPSWWSCALAGHESQYTERGEYTEPNRGFFSARSSSQYGMSDGLWSMDYAIDGKISEENHHFFHSLSESNPWLELSMPEGYISGVEIVTRYGCCADRVRDIEVRAGMDPVPNGFKGRLTINTKVATFVGPADANLKTYRINFDRSILAKYVTLQRIGEGVSLEINEVTMIR